MTLISHFNRKSLFIGIGKSIGAGILSHGVFVSLSSVYKIHKRFMSSGSKKPPRIRYSKNRYNNARNLTHKKRVYRKTQDQENSHIKNIVKTTPRVSSINPYKNSTINNNINKPTATEALISIKKDTPVIFTDKRAFLANIEGSPNNTLDNIFAKTLIPTISGNISTEKTTNHLLDNKTLSLGINQNLEKPTFNSNVYSELESTKNIAVNENLAQVYLKDFYEKKIKEYFLLDQDKKWTLEKQEYLKVIRGLLDNFKCENNDNYRKDSRDIEELTKIKNLYETSTKEWIPNLITNFSREIIISCRTISHYEKEILRYTEMISILNTKGTILPDPAFHEIARRLGVIINNDAIYKDIYGNSIIVKEGEGSTLTRDVYTLFSKNKKFYFTEDLIQIDSQGFINIFAKITSGDFLVGSIKQDLLLSTTNKFIESGDERHMHLCVKIQQISKENLYLSLGFFTSNKDQGAIKLTNKQYINNEDHLVVKKEQWFRPFNQLLHIRENDFSQNEKATNYAQNNNCENINIQKTLITEIIKREKELKANAIREVLYVTKEHIKKIALEKGAIYLDTLKKNLKNLQIKMQHLPEKEKSSLENERENQYNKIKKQMEEAAFYSETPYEIQELNKIKLLLENEKKKNRNV